MRGWARFFQLTYYRALRAVRLVIKDGRPSALDAIAACSHGPKPLRPKHISKLVVHFEESPKKWEGQTLFMVKWVSHDKNGQSGEIFVINSYSGLEPSADPVQPEG